VSNCRRLHLTFCFLLQMFLLKIPGGLFGAEVEHRLLNVLELNSHCDQCDEIHWYVVITCGVFIVTSH